LPFLENLGGTSSAQTASNIHCLRDSIEISVLDLLLTYQSVVSVARTDNSLEISHLSMQIYTDNNIYDSKLLVRYCYSLNNFFSSFPIMHISSCE